ncbi:hypothetical protein WH47_02669 [Habropoda laboriosa]|uniref:Uncharacterized protein n=1 Tax=Habropoda laboriosa TaxID=597456 RepID=A0A0L7QX39_9HYME|nr:hypothetical protein WH47_02669 [Habropoda laboriosa]
MDRLYRYPHQRIEEVRCKGVIQEKASRSIGPSNRYIRDNSRYLFPPTIPATTNPSLVPPLLRKRRIFLREIQRTIGCAEGMLCERLRLMDDCCFEIISGGM